MTTERGLVRSEQDRMIGGVIGGLAERFDMDATLLRVIYVVGSALSAAFPGILVYLLLWVAMPAERTYS
ncbi:PspC domain-containing protein [soil metagenome]|jgi:phage shock protein PspC (stress-responsive transcriptional regulator)